MAVALHPRAAARVERPRTGDAGETYGFNLNPEARNPKSKNKHEVLVCLESRECGWFFPVPKVFGRDGSVNTCPQLFA